MYENVALHNGILHNMFHLILCRSLMHIRSRSNVAGEPTNRGKSFVGRENDSVSEQKTWSDGGRQPMGCGHGDGGDGATVAAAGGVGVCDGGWARARLVLVFLPCHIVLVCSRARLLSAPLRTALLTRAEPHTHKHAWV